MTILEFLARTFPPPLPDGSFVFRPWGARGPCYALTSGQRKQRAWCLLAFYVVAFAALWGLPEVTATRTRVTAFALGFIVLHYVLYWLFALGLQTTDKPSRSTRAQRRTALSAYSRALGRPVLWIFLILSWIFMLGGVLVMIEGNWTDGLLCILFFGVCAATFTRQLWLIRKARGAGSD